MPDITNEVFEAALADQNNRRIIAKVCNEYQGMLSPEELAYRGYMALYKCLKKHDPSNKNKFTTSLTRHTIWECKKAIRDLRRHVALPSLSDDTLFYLNPIQNILEVRDCLDALPEACRSILYSYYYKRMTLREIGKANGYTYVAAYHKLRQAEDEFRRLYSVE